MKQRTTVPWQQKRVSSQLMTLLDATAEELRKLLPPTSGTVRDRHGVVHQVIGDMTCCDLEWCRVTRSGLPQTRTGWSATGPEAIRPVTCAACLADFASRGD